MGPGTESFGVMFELIGVASLCTWTVCLAVGIGFLSADRALLIGVPGTLLGGVLVHYMGLPGGPTLAGYPIVPALAGTTLVLTVYAYARRIREHRRARREEASRSPVPVREWPAWVHRSE